MTSPHILRFPRMTALAAGLAMALLGPDVSAATRVVANCNDSGTGSLREAVTAATKNDIIQLPSTCNLITLSSAITLNVGNLTLNGPGASALEINGAQRDRVFTQTTIGTLFINGLTITNGLVTATSGNANGGCISAISRVQLTDSVVSGCTASANIGAGNAFGGGIYATGEVVLIRSTVSGNNAFSSENRKSYGGGVFAGAGFSTESSTIRENTTSSGAGTASEGGGVYIFDGTVAINNSTISGNQAGNDGGGLYINSTSGVNISNSTISGNQADDDGGGLYINSASSVSINNSTISGNQAGNNGGGLYIDVDVPTATISNSTISGNRAGVGGGVLLYSVATTLNNSTISGNRADRAGGVFSNGDLTVSNSTIAFNTSDQAQNSNQLMAAGLDLKRATLTLNSTIIANNRAAGEASDLSDRDNNGAMRTSAFAGSKNLIYARDKLDLKAPMDTASVCPRLQRLAPHGGPTQTLALRSGSFAIGHGIDTTLPPLPFDQRGMGFARAVGAVDIGAYERQVNEQDDALFFSSFESGCDE